MGRSRRGLWDVGLVALAFVASSVGLVLKRLDTMSVSGALWTAALCWVAGLGWAFVSIRIDPAARRRRRWWLAGVASIVGLLVIAGAAWSGVRDRQVAADLRRHGVEVPAEIVDALSRSREVRVAFETDTGQRVETWVPVGTTVQRGPTRIRYLADDPEVARLVADPTPRSKDLPGLLIFGAFCGVVALGLVAACRAIDRSLGLRPR